MRLATLLAALFLLEVEARQQQPPPTFRADSRTVALYVTVQDSGGRLVPGLTRADFEVRDVGRPVEITLFSNARQPITMVLLLDMSGSMAPHVGRIRDATLQLVDLLTPADRVRLGTFGEQILFTPFLTSDKVVMRDILHADLHPGGETPLWLAMLRSMRSLEGERGRRVILTLTDGHDSCRGRACVPFDRVRDFAHAGEFMVYAIGLAGWPFSDEIKGLAETSGGGHFQLADNANLRETFTRVAAELHQQYLIGFTPAVLDGKRHAIDARVRRPGMTARTRADYLASAR